ncbi:hypothetical protein, partial [Oceanivirga salmonicida]
KVERKYVITTTNDEFPIKDDTIKWTKLEKNKFEMHLDNVLEIDNNTREVDEIIFEIFSKG